MPVPVFFRGVRSAPICSSALPEYGGSPSAASEISFSRWDTRAVFIKGNTILWVPDGCNERLLILHCRPDRIKYHSQKA